MITAKRWVLLKLLIWHCVSAYEEVRPLCSPNHSNCSTTLPGLWKNGLSIFKINGVLLDVITREEAEVNYACYLASFSIDDIYLPKFDNAVSFESVYIDNCAPPNLSYAEAVAALNITGFRNLTLQFEVCNQEYSLHPHNFIGLKTVQYLNIKCDTYSYNVDYNLDLNFLDNLDTLKFLELHGFFIRPFPSWNRLHAVKLSGGGVVDKLQPWGGCQELEQLVIMNWDVMELPDKWLANCSRLNSLHLEGLTKLSGLPNLMINSSYLRTLKVIYCGLDSLPSDMFDHCDNLRVLDLSLNSLESINRSQIESITLLEELNLTHNTLMVDIIPDLKPLTSLKSLTLDHNLHADVCELPALHENEPVKPWPLLPSLERLSLKQTAATNLCTEWSQSLPKLKEVDLTISSIKQLRYQDVELIRSNGWEVDLRHNSFVAIIYAKSDYDAVVKNVNLSSKIGTIKITKYPRVCDCLWYWFARAVQERPGYVLLPDLLCYQEWEDVLLPIALDQMPLESFVCQIDCKEGCKCFWRIHDNTTQVNCTGAGHDQIPQIPLLRDIRMANNHINGLSAQDFPETLEYLDLQYNQLSTLDPETTLMMFSRSTMRYRLSGNPFQCVCNNSALVTALQAHAHQIQDYENLTCADTKETIYIKNANMNIQCLKEYAPVVGSVLGFITFLFLIIFALYYRYRKETHIVLYAWGWCNCCVNEAKLDADKKYDVFISFAYEDTSIVMDELLPGLEKEPHAFSVCVHHRDWSAGDWIPLQIAHSVEESRRTVIVLSKNFLASAWAVLEFRTAHAQALKDKRVRLIIIVVGDVINDQEMDDELRLYLTTNTYIKWGDPRFWEKLLYAMPHRKRDEGRLRAAGEEVVLRLKPSDPPIVLRNEVALEILDVGESLYSGIQIVEEEL